MTRRPRRNHSPALKAKVALAALKGDRTMSELAKQFDLHPNQIKQLKDQLLDSVSDVFDDKPRASKTPEIDVKSLHAKIGQLALENDFLGGALCLEALNETIRRFGRPEIMNTDQGSQFTSIDFIKALKDAGIQISMDGKGAWLDNVFVERLWRSIKYEEVYLNAFETGSHARAGIGNWISYYNDEHPHSTHAGLTPSEAYETGRGKDKLAA